MKMKEYKGIILCKNIWKKAISIKNSAGINTKQ